MKELGDLEKTLGYHFSNSVLLEQALTHGSVRHEQQVGEVSPGLAPLKDNERLEFLGDAIVGMVVAELLYRRYPELHEGELTRLRAALVSRKHLGVVGTGLELGSYLRLGKAEERNGGRRKAVLLANCVEALIGAIYLEGGFAAVAVFVEQSVVEPYLAGLRDELREHSAIGDYKTALQELLQARRAGQPEYAVVAESGPDHRKRFVVEARISTGSLQSAQAESSTKKKAEQEAARELYALLTDRAKAESGLEKRAVSASNTPFPLTCAVEEHLSRAGTDSSTANSKPGLRRQGATKSQAFPAKNKAVPEGATLDYPSLSQGDQSTAGWQPTGSDLEPGTARKSTAGDVGKLGEWASGKLRS